MFNFSNYARDDLLEYRQHYPTKRGEDPAASDNVKFYHNQLHAEPEHVKIDDILHKWPGNYRFLESCHSYIQWLFPIQEKGLNYEAQVLMRHEIPLLRNSPEAMDRILRSFSMMCDFYGMRCFVDMKNRQCTFQRNIGGEGDKKHVWIKCYRNLNSSGHNYLRITRILKFLGEMGLEFIKIAWLSFFAQEIIVTRALKNCLRSFCDYWVGTIYDDAERAKFTAWYRGLQADPGSAPVDTVGFHYETFDSDDEEEEVRGSAPTRAYGQGDVSSALGDEGRAFSSNADAAASGSHTSVSGNDAAATSQRVDE